MYIQYTSKSEPADPEDGSSWRTVEGGTYRPTWLIRASDWQKVPGIDAKEGYCTLSYSMFQSSEVLMDEYGTLSYVDDGLHQIISLRKSRRLPPSRWKTRSYSATYEDILQQICKDFDISYLWFDQICVDQENRNTKYNTIREMYLVYSNARFTVAMIPEIHRIDNPHHFHSESKRVYTESKSQALRQALCSSWWSRSFILEELCTSTRILLVGEDTWLWFAPENPNVDSTLLENGVDFISTLLDFTNQKWRSANQILRHTGFQIPAKIHDKIFALDNILDGIIPINVNYSMAFNDVQNDFYRQLVEHDFSVMCFGANHGRHSTMGHFGLPSWTGVNGLHTFRPVLDINLYQDTCNIMVDREMCLHLRCRGYTMRPTKFEDDGLYDDSQQFKQSRTGSEKLEYPTDDNLSLLNYSRSSMLNKTGCYATHRWEPDQSGFDSPVLLLSLTEDCDECVILSIIFDSILPRDIKNKDGYNEHQYQHTYLLPVLKKVSSATEEERYKAIGIMYLKDYEWGETPKGPQALLNEIFTNVCNEPEDFIIE